MYNPYIAEYRSQEEIWVKHPVVGGPEDDLELNGFQLFEKYSWYSIQFIWAANLASIGQVSGNMSICEANTTTFINKSMSIEGLYIEEEYAEAGLATYQILKSIDGILFSCYYTTFEYYLALGLYVDTLTDANRLLFNLAHNLGAIYDLVEELVYRMSQAE